MTDNSVTSLVINPTISGHYYSVVSIADRQTNKTKALYIFAPESSDLLVLGQTDPQYIVCILSTTYCYRISC